jgi:hypothetical protein
MFFRNLKPWFVIKLKILPVFCCPIVPINPSALNSVLMNIGGHRDEKKNLVYTLNGDPVWVYDRSMHRDRAYD